MSALKILNIKFYILLMSLLIALACSNEQPLESGNGGGTMEATLSRIQSQIFSPRCAIPGCHVPGGAGPMPLRNRDESFNVLVNVPSTEKPEILRVKPNDPDNSYLIQKLEGRPGISGSRMPLGGPFLSESQINEIKEWIRNGAQKN